MCGVVCTALAVVALLVGCVPLASAVETQIRSFRSAAEFAEGELDHVSISAAGQLVLSPNYRRLLELDEPVAWAAVVAGGDLLVGTGHEGRVLRIPMGGGKATVAFDSAELEVYAIASAADGTAYAGTSPGGKVYRLPKDGGAATVLFDPEERYIWALVPAPDGSVYVATGDKGAVYRVAPGGTATPVLAVEETHVLSLALALDGTLYAGTGGNGYVYRVPKTGAPGVLLDTAGSEVKALALDAAGNLFAVSTGRSMAGPEAPPSAYPSMTNSAEATPAPEDTPPGGSGAAEVPATAAVKIAAMTPVLPPPASAAGGSRQSWLYRIRPDGLPEEIWRTTSETVHAMAILGGQVVLGTGDEGMLLTVEPSTGRGSILADLPGAQITGIAARPGGIALVTSNLASVWTVDEKIAGNGIYTSPVIDAGHFAAWGKVTLDSIGVQRVATRSGNTLKPGSHWSEWQDAASAVLSPRARYLQVRLRLNAAAAARPDPEEHPGSPLVRRFDVAYLPYNLAPRVSAITLLEPGTELISSQPVATAKPRARGKSAAARSMSAPREQETAAARAARWEASDPNGDDLAFSVLYRGLGEQEWKILAAELVEPFVSFDSTTLPDGRYELKVVASDEPANSDDLVLAGDMTSEPFVVDNTPPRLELARKGSGSGEGVIAIAAEIKDERSAIHWAEYSLDAGPWRAVLPEDEVFDERDEHVLVELEGLDAGEHTLVLRSEDAAHNIGSGKIVFR